MERNRSIMILISPKQRHHYSVSIFSTSLWRRVRQDKVLVHVNIELYKKRVCDGVILTKNAVLTSAACGAKPGGKVFYKTFDLKARKVPRATIVSLQKHRKAKRIKLKNKKGIGHRNY